MLSRKTDKLNSLSIPSLILENSQRTVKILKPADAYQTYKDFILYYALDQVVDHCRNNQAYSLNDVLELLSKPALRLIFENVGGQMIPADELKLLKEKIVSYEIISWEQVHDFFARQGKNYLSQKLKHAVSSLQEVHKAKSFNETYIHEMLNWYCRLYTSRCV